MHAIYLLVAPKAFACVHGSALSSVRVVYIPGVLTIQTVVVLFYFIFYKGCTVHVHGCMLSQICKFAHPRAQCVFCLVKVNGGISALACSWGRDDSFSC